MESLARATMDDPCFSFFHFFVLWHALRFQAAEKEQSERTLTVDRAVDSTTVTPSERCSSSTLWPDTARPVMTVIVKPRPVHA